MTTLHIYTGRSYCVTPSWWAVYLSRGQCPLCKAQGSIVPWRTEDPIGMNYRCTACHWPGVWRAEGPDLITASRSSPARTEDLLTYMEYEKQCFQFENCGRDERGRFMRCPDWPFETATVKLI